MQITQSDHLDKFLRVEENQFSMQNAKHTKMTYILRRALPPQTESKMRDKLVYKEKRQARETTVHSAVFDFVEATTKVDLRDLYYM